MARSLIGTWIIGSFGASITFDADGGVSGRGGVNSFRGRYEATDGEIEFGPLAVTLMAGPDDAMQHESHLLAVLVGCQPYVVDDEGLTIGDGPSSVRFHLNIPLVPVG